MCQSQWYPLNSRANLGIFGHHVLYIVVIALYLADILAVSKSWNDWFKKTVIGMYLYLFLVRLVHVKHLMPVVAGPLKNVLKLLVALGLRALTACWACFLYVLSTLKPHAVRKRLQGGLHLSGLKGWKSQLRLRHGFRAWMDQGDSLWINRNSCGFSHVLPLSICDLTLDFSRIHAVTAEVATRCVRDSSLFSPA